MKVGVQFQAWAAIIAAAGVLSACDSQQDMGGFAGNYAGQLISQLGSATSEEALLARISAPQDGRMVIVGHSLNDPSKTDVNWQLAQDASGQLTLQATGGIDFQGALGSSTTNCRSSGPADPTAKPGSKAYATLCADGDLLSIEIVDPAQRSSIFLKLTKQIAGAPTVLETPATYTSDQLRDMALTQSFSSRLEFENVVATKLASRSEYLNMIPHLSNVSIAAILSYSGIVGTLDAIGDLVPFLLPDRWLQAKQAAQLSDAEQFASKIMQLDSAETVEGLAVVSAQNIVLHDQLKQDLALVQNIEQSVADAEKSGHLPVGASLSIGSVDNGLQQTISNLESTMALQMTQLAQAVGFVNPAAISNITMSPLGDIDNPPNLTLDQMEARVVQSSPEINQLNLLIDAARTAEAGRYFQWMDPSGDPQGGIGFALPDYVRIGAASVDQLAIAREQLNATLLHQITDAYNNYGGWIESYQLAAAGVATQVKRIDLAKLDLMTPSADYAIDELRDALTQLSANHVALLSAQYAWYATVSQINRLLVQGPYQLPPSLPAPKPKTGSPTALVLE